MHFEKFISKHISCAPENFVPQVFVFLKILFPKFFLKFLFWKFWKTGFEKFQNI